MKLERLEIRHLVGVPQPLNIRPAADRVTVVTGPNASGKSSLVRALRALLYPGSDAGHVHVLARWQSDDGTRQAERNGTATRWLADGRKTDAPPLPDADSLGAWLIGAESLITAGETEQRIGHRLRTLLAGGYDLHALEDALAAPRFPRNLSNDLRRTRQAIADSEREYAALADELARLDEYNRRLDEARAAGRQLARIERALELAAVKDEQRAVKRTLADEFPAGMDRLDANSADRLRALDERIASRTAERREKTGELTQLESGDHADDPDALETARGQLADHRDRLISLEGQLDRQQQALEATDGHLAAVAAEVGVDDAAAIPQIAPAGLEALEQQAERVDAGRRRLDELEGEIERLAGDDAAIGGEDPESARRIVLDYLRLARTGAIAVTGWLLLTAAVAGAAAWQWPQIMTAEWSDGLVVGLGLAALAPLGYLGYLLGRWQRRRGLRRRFERLYPDLTGILRRDPDEALRRLDQEVAAAGQQRERRRRIEHLRSQHETVQARMHDDRRQLQALLQRHGLRESPQLIHSFGAWCHQLHQGQQFRDQQLQQQRTRDRIERSIDSFRKAAMEQLTETGLADNVAETVDSSEIGRLLHRLDRRIRTAAERRERIRALHARLDELDRDLDTDREHQGAIFRAAGLEDGDRDGLDARLARLPDWRELDARRLELAERIRRLEGELDGEPHLLDQVQNRQIGELQARRDELRRHCDERDELVATINRLEEKHSQTLEQRRLEQLHAEHEAQQQALADQLDHHWLAVAGGVLIDDVARAHEQHHRPRALTAAAHWFGRFTRERYRLGFTDATFYATDTVEERDRPLDELSSATRSQLLLAVRLAWIEQAERGRESLPVFLDEVLGNADPARYRAVVEAVGEMVAGGRQVIYLTARAEEVAYWRAGGQSPEVIELAPVEDPVELAPVEPASRELPDPEAMSATEWAKQAGIGAIDPWRGAGAVEVFHLLRDDPALAARLMTLELDRLGVLEQFVASEAAGALLDERARDDLARRCRAARMLLDAWCRRHARPVDDAALAASNAYSDTFDEAVRELNRRLDGDPRRLVSALREGEVSGFYRRYMDALEDWLEDNDWLDDDGVELPSVAEIAAVSGLPAEVARSVRDGILAAIDDPLSAS